MGITNLFVSMKSSLRLFIYILSFATSFGNPIQDSINSDKGTTLDPISNHIAPFDSEVTPQKEEDISIESINPWNYSTMFFLFSSLSIILVFCGIYGVSKFTSVEEKEFVKFSCPKTRDGWYADNLLASEKKVLSQCNIKKEDFVVVWS